MSGGFFDYDEYRINNMHESIQSLLNKMGKLRDKSELWATPEYYDRYPEELVHETYPEEVVEQFKKAIDVLKLAEVYARRVDYIISGDDGGDCFLRRLKEDLGKLDLYNKEIIHTLAGRADN